jgi:hypothetical protein
MNGNKVTRKIRKMNCPVKRNEFIPVIPPIKIKYEFSSTINKLSNSI